MPTLHIYTRVSTAVQADEGMSLETQRELGIKRAKELGFEYQVWNEGGRSSNHEGVDKRPVLSQVYAKIKSGEIKHFFVYDQSRLSRNDEVSSLFRVECNRNGVTLYTRDGRYDLSNTTDQFMKKIMDAVAELDNAQRAERTRLGKLARIKQGRWMGGPPPYGYAIENHHLVVNPEEAKWVVRIFEEYADKTATIDIKMMLDTHGVQPRRGGGTWVTHTTLVFGTTPISARVRPCVSTVHDCCLVSCGQGLRRPEKSMQNGAQAATRFVTFTCYVVFYAAAIVGPY